MNLDAALLQRATGCTAALAERYAQPLAEACAAYGISATPARLAAFLAQIGHESGGFRYVREIASGAAYEGRRDLGNTEPGDGVRYRGHGLIQITGRSNHAQMRDRLRQKLGTHVVPDFEADPEALEDPRWACWSAAAFWDSRNLNVLADAGEFDRITQKINGGQNGAADRRARWERAKQALASEPILKTLPAAPAQPTEAQPMLPLMSILGQSLIAAFTPLASEKIQREISRHTDRPEVAEQVTTALVEAAKTATGLSDPIEAVAAVRKDPAAMAQVEQSTLDKLASMAPLLQQLESMDRQRFADEEHSREAAHARYKTDWDMTPTLVYGALGLVATLVLFVCGIAVYQAVEADQIAPEVWAQVAGLIGFATGIAVTIFSFRFGTTRNSTAKDVMIGELSRNRTPAQ